MKVRTIVFFSYPRGGKDKHSKLLIEDFKNKRESFLYLNVGEIFRNIKNPELLKNFESIMSKGHLIPNYVTHSIVGYLLLIKLSGRKHFISNGFPRNLEQAKFLLKIMNFLNRKIDVIHIKITQEEALRRGRRNNDRNDDNYRVLRRRFKVFTRNKNSLVNFFKANCNFLEVDGNDSIEVVHQRIIKILNLG